MSHANFSTLQAAKKSLGERIRRLRIKKGWTQHAFAQMCGIDPSYISRIERGKSNLSCSILATIARKLGTSVFSLLKGIA
jgi:transcriptional regulator with XRE-family HTH domain